MHMQIIPHQPIANFIRPEVLKLPVLPVLSVMDSSGPTLDVFLPVQMSGRALEGPKDQNAHISASICPTEKYNLSNCIRMSQATHFHAHFKVLHSFSVWNLKW